MSRPYWESERWELEREEQKEEQKEDELRPQHWKKDDSLRFALLLIVGASLLGLFFGVLLLLG